MSKRKKTWAYEEVAYEEWLRDRLRNNPKAAAAYLNEFLDFCGDELDVPCLINAFKAVANACDSKATHKNILQILSDAGLRLRVDVRRDG